MEEITHRRRILDITSIVWSYLQEHSMKGKCREIERELLAQVTLVHGFDELSA